MPGAEAMACSSGEVMKALTVSGLAPGSAVVTVTTVVVTLGYWRTVMPNQARMPSSTMARLMALASTGRLTKMSVNFIARSSGLHGVVDGDLRPVVELGLAGRHHGLPRLQAALHHHGTFALVTGGDHALVHD